MIFSGSLLIPGILCVVHLRKIDKLIQVSREICKKPHKFIILKGNAQEELEKAMKNKIFKYSLEKSITSKDSKIVIWNR